MAHGRLEAVRYLLSRGANPRISDSDGIQPLHWVARAPQNDIEIARLLVAAGANPAALDGQHKATPAAWADFQRRPELSRFLQSSERTGST